MDNISSSNQGKLSSSTIAFLTHITIQFYRGHTFSKVVYSLGMITLSFSLLLARKYRSSRVTVKDYLITHPTKYILNK